MEGVEGVEAGSGRSGYRNGVKREEGRRETEDVVKGEGSERR